ncbi:hypothetical protein GCM10017044_03560 [Kordiimonas sediminis]|uniref:Methyltransferase domain-containing protein n=2 Tax=Kordiimonas sediminis TaxID=1735581 RepID=A0A919ALT5_9PROT|nr:hypothetical protein GCM10017044_03560 [Kordiimonas sediminis]
MLAYHLSQETDLASRRLETIGHITDWIDDHAGLEGRRLLDLGCGPGLYASQFAERGAIVHGVDFSSHSIGYAREKAATAKQSIRYDVADYLEGSLPDRQDIVTLIYCDLCVLSPAQRQHLYTNVRRSLVPGGMFIVDVMHMSAFSAYTEGCDLDFNMMAGFWSENPYYAIHCRHKYAADFVSLDAYTVVEERRTFRIFNWLRYFTPQMIGDELLANGFTDITVDEKYLTGGRASSIEVAEDDSSAQTFAVIARIPS